MAVQESDVLAVIRSRPATIPDGFSDTVIQTYIDEAKPIMLDYCNALPQNVANIPDVLKYPWTEIATTLMNSVSALTTGEATRIKEGDEEIMFGGAKNVQAQLLDNMSINNMRILNRFRTLF